MSTIQATTSACTQSKTFALLRQPYPVRCSTAVGMTPNAGQHGNDHHAADVAWAAERLCADLRVPDALARRVVSGARTHDIGKAFVPRELLERPGPLNGDEREQVKLHASHGASLLQAESERRGLDLSIEISVARLHHERWDGSGYPHGLAGTEIPLGARIVAVADVYDALVTARAYKAAWPHELALEAIQDGRGTHFDPECADALIRIARRLPASWTRSAQSVHGRARNLKRDR